MNKKPKLNLMGVMLMIGLIPLFTALIVAAFVSYNSLEEEMKSATQETLSATAELTSEYFGCDWDAWMERGIEETDESFVDAAKADDLDITVFKAEADGQVLRYLSSIRDASGNRVSGTPAADEITQKVFGQGQTYFGENVVINGEKYSVCYKPLTKPSGERVGMAFAGQPEKDLEAALQSLLTKTIVISAIIAIIFAVVIILVSRIIIKPLAAITKSTVRLSEGYINDRIVFSSNVKETVQLGNAARTLRDNLQSIVSDIRNTSGSLVTNVNDTKGLCDEASSGSSMVDQAVGELALTATTLAESVQSLNQDIIDIGTNIETISQSVDTLNSASDIMNQISTEATQDITDVYDSSAQAVDAVANIAEHMEKLNEAISRVTAATEMIANIASQTSLLSLNASIEAARAGEMGKGFAVVAGEIGNLASTSSNSVNQINEIVKDILALSEQSAKVTEEIKEIIAGEQAKVVKTQVSFTKLKEQIDASLVEIGKIATDTESLAASKTSAVSAVTELSAISEENAASCEESSASVTNISANILEINERSVSLADMADTLEKAISAFKED